MSLSDRYREFRIRRKIARFLRSGQRPWSRGYLEHRDREVRRVLADGAFRPNALPAGYGFRLDERIVEYPWVLSRLPQGPGRLLDAGSALNFAYLLDQPVLARKDLHICTLAPEERAYWSRGVSYLYGDLRNLPYRDAWFDWIVSISTLEHVGMDNTVIYASDPAFRESQPRDCLKAVAELRRVLKPDGACFITVPYGKAATHAWLQVFDQTGIDALAGAFGPASRSESYFRYHPDGWRVSSAADASNATWFNIHAGQGYDPDFAASARAVCCLELRP